MVVIANLQVFGIFRPLVFGHLQFRPSFLGSSVYTQFWVICSLGMLYFCRNPQKNIKNRYKKYDHEPFPTHHPKEPTVGQGRHKALNILGILGDFCRFVGSLYPDVFRKSPSGKVVFLVGNPDLNLRDWKS